MPKTLPVDAPRALCADRLDLVDAAYARPGKASELRALCAVCPLAETCLTLALDHREEGVWGGTSPNLRSRTNPALKRTVARPAQRVCTICGRDFEGKGTAKLCGEACRTENIRRYMQRYRARRAKR